MPNQELRQTAAAILGPRDITALSAAAAAELSAPEARSTAVAFLKAVRADPLFDVVGYEPAVYQAGFDLFANRPNKSLVPDIWSKHWDYGAGTMTLSLSE
jgi:hypothetical protein